MLVKTQRTGAWKTGKMHQMFKMHQMCKMHKTAMCKMHIARNEKALKIKQHVSFFLRLKINNTLD